MLEEPEGWSELQQKAQEERDPAKLIQIIDQLNALLTAYEKRVALETSPQPPQSRYGKSGVNG